MPSREENFVTDGLYHVFNKTIEDIPIFSNDKIAFRFIKTLLYYRSLKSTYKYSLLKELDQKSIECKWNQIMERKYFKVDILSYCLMPNHYHLLLKQLQENGVKTFMANVLNSITRYYNVVNERKGPVFLTQFKSKKIFSEEQLIYVSRYIHTNPYASSLVDINGIFSYKYSSINTYKVNDPNSNKINTDTVLNFFNNKKNLYKKFIEKNANDQKARHLLKYTEKWFC